MFPSPKANTRYLSLGKLFVEVFKKKREGVKNACYTSVCETKETKESQNAI